MFPQAMKIYGINKFTLSILGTSYTEDSGLTNGSFGKIISFQGYNFHIYFIIDRNSISTGSASRRAS